MEAYKHSEKYSVLIANDKINIISLHKNSTRFSKKDYDVASKIAVI